MPIDIDLLNTLQRTITGDWEYLCVPTAPQTFEGGQTARGGRLRFDVHVTPLGLSVIVEGQRQWASTTPSGVRADPVKLSYPIEWSGRGSIFDEDGKKILRYTFGDNLTDSETVDCFVISEHKDLPGKRALVLETGSFRHIPKDGPAIRGTVRLRQMIHRGDMQWGPWDPSKPAFVGPVVDARALATEPPGQSTHPSVPSVHQHVNIMGQSSGVVGNTFASGDISYGAAKPASQMVEAKEAFLAAIQHLPADLYTQVREQFNQVYDEANATADKSVVQMKAKALEEFLRSGKALASGSVAAAWTLVKPWLGMGK